MNKITTVAFILPVMAIISANVVSSEPRIQVDPPPNGNSGGVQDNPEIGKVKSDKFWSTMDEKLAALYDHDHHNDHDDSDDNTDSECVDFDDNEWCEYVNPEPCVPAAVGAVAAENVEIWRDILIGVRTQSCNKLQAFNANGDGDITADGMVSRSETISEIYCEDATIRSIHLDNENLSNGIQKSSSKVLQGRATINGTFAYLFKNGYKNFALKDFAFDIIKSGESGTIVHVSGLWEMDRKEADDTDTHLTGTMHLERWIREQNEASFCLQLDVMSGLWFD